MPIPDHPDQEDHRVNGGGRERVGNGSFPGIELGGIAGCFIATGQSMTPVPNQVLQ